MLGLTTPCPKFPYCRVASGSQPVETRRSKHGTAWALVRGGLPLPSYTALSAGTCWSCCHLCFGWQARLSARVGEGCMPGPSVGGPLAASLG